MISGQWYEFDDQYVTEVHETVVQSVEAYVLFYRCAPWAGTGVGAVSGDLWAWTAYSPGLDSGCVRGCWSREGFQAWEEGFQFLRKSPLTAGNRRSRVWAFGRWGWL